MSSGQTLRPFLTAELGEETCADRAVVALTLARWRSLCRPNRADDICPADDPDNFAFAHDRHALDPLRFQQCRDFAKVHALGDGHDITRHDVLDGAAMRFDIIAGKVGGEMVEPPRAAAHAMAACGTDFSAMQ